MKKAYNASQRNIAVIVRWEAKEDKFIDWYARNLLNNERMTMDTIQHEMNAKSSINGQYDLYNTYNIGTKLPHPFSDAPIPPIIKH